MAADVTTTCTENSWASVATAAWTSTAVTTLIVPVDATEATWPELGAGGGGGSVRPTTGLLYPRGNG